jgi:hypothetical protein
MPLANHPTVLMIVATSQHLNYMLTCPNLPAETSKRRQPNSAMGHDD